MTGRLVVVTGLDGAGTSSLAAQLSALDKGSHLVKTPMPPFDTCRAWIDTVVREESQAAHYLFYLASVVHASARIELLLETGNVYCVRYLIDTVVSHRVAGLDVELCYQAQLYKVRPPDITFFVDVDENLRQERITKRGKGRLDGLLDNDDFRGRFLAEFGRLAQHFITIHNHATVIDMVNQAVAHLTWVQRGE